jgi:glyoxylase-like metal-dependent hydrolase (beta-lactamase superfamily II)
VSAALHYPLENEPQTGNGSAVEIAPGVLWLRMPLFVALPWINVWALADEGGWTLVDSGIHSPNTIQRVAKRLCRRVERPSRDQSVGHPYASRSLRHGRMAGRPVQSAIVDDSLGIFHLPHDDRGYRTSCAAARRSSFTPVPDGTNKQSKDTGESSAHSANTSIRCPSHFAASLMAKHCRSARNEWTVVVGNGHSPEHACLYCAALRLLIAGDQVLPKISSNVSVYPTEPDANPLADWLNSLAAIERRIPDDVLVLPAHNSPFTGLHARTRQLTQSHHEGLARLEDMLAEPKRVIDVFPALFNRAISPELLGMATGEALAHLNYLLATGRAVRQQDERGVWWWRRVSRR